MPRTPLEFESELLRAAIRKKVSEKLGEVYRDLCSYEVPPPGDAENHTERQEREKLIIIDLMSEASSSFFQKMYARNQANDKRRREKHLHTAPSSE